MKINKLFLLAMGLVAVGCNDNQIEEESLINNAQGEAVEVELSATIAPASRATSDVGEYDGVTAVDLQFEVGDHIGVYLNNEAIGFTHENTDFEYLQNADGTPKFVPQQQMILLGSGNNVYAYYPFEATDAGFEGTVTRSANRGTWDGYHYFEIPAVQQQDTIEVDGVKKPFQNLSKYVKLISKETQMYKVGNTMKADMVFYHAFAYVTMNVQNTYADKDINIVEATVKLLDKEGNPMPIVGDFAAALDNEGNELMVKASDYEGASQGTVATVNSTDASGCVLTLDPEQSAYITAAVAPAACDGYEVRIVTDKGFVYKVRKEGLGEAFAVGQGVNRKLSIPISDETLSTEVVNDEVAEYMLHMDKEHIVLDLAANIELKINRTSDDAWGGANTKTITINGGADGLAANRTVSFNMSEQLWSDVDLVNTDATLYINNLKLQTTGWHPTSKAGFSKTDLMFNCKVDLEKVLSLSAIMAHRSFTANTLVVYDSKAGASTNNYALWLAPAVEEQIVNISGFQTISMTAKGERGIKIDATTQYASFDKANLGPQKVVLTLKGDNHFDTTEKAAILVRTKVGAEINIEGNMNITSVFEDKVNHIWIDEGAYTKEDVEKITIKNARWKLEGATWSVENDVNGAVVTAYAENQAGLKGAIEYGMDKIALTDGEYTLPDVPVVNDARTLQISGSKDAVITLDGTPDLAGNSLMLTGATVNTTRKGDGVKASSVYYNEVTVNGSLSFYGQTANLMNSTITIPNALYLYVGSVNTATISGCTFNTAGRAIMIHNPGDTDGKIANNVTVKDCIFKGTKPAYTTGTLVGQPCAAIEIDNLWKTYNAGAAHQLTTSGNSVAEAFSSEWRIENYVETAEGENLTVNGKPYAGYYMGRTNGEVYKLTADDAGNVEATPAE